ncbi:MAG: hypothetical protein GWO11_04300, partial [Desulfuromonadales bacterium]|nr:hypothetical protein [Desulfuromonadales bacterium]NIR33646.1 hypothetical protein [Desulfuromonadales bacterium]NIS43933.1 hypothetical protein [Desulfuromonadales bacterium]
MATENTAIHQLVNESINNGTALSAQEIRDLKEKNNKAVKLYKLVFWIAIAIFNVFLWVPMPIAAGLKMGVAGLSLACAFILPIYGIRKHNKYLS